MSESLKRALLVVGIVLIMLQSCDALERRQASDEFADAYNTFVAQVDESGLEFDVDAVTTHPLVEELDHYEISWSDGMDGSIEGEVTTTAQLNTAVSLYKDLINQSCTNVAVRVNRSSMIAVAAFHGTPVTSEDGKKFFFRTEKEDCAIETDNSVLEKKLPAGFTLIVEEANAAPTGDPIVLLSVESPAISLKDITEEKRDAFNNQLHDKGILLWF